MGQVTVYSNADSRIYEPNLGAGASDYLPAGLWSGNVYRSFVKFALPDWTALGIRRITSAYIKLRNSSQVYVGRGGTPRLIIRRVTTNWSEGSADSMTTSNAITWSNQPQATSIEEVDTGTLSGTDGAWNTIAITALVRRWAPTTVESGSGYANYGVRLAAQNEASTAGTTEFYSRETTSDPQLVINYETNTAPGVSTLMVPAANADGSASIASLAIVTSSPLVQGISFGAKLNDPDPGDYITGAEVQVFADSATDGVPGTPLIDSIDTAVTGSPTTYSKLISTTGLLTPGTTYRARLKFRDKESVWGAWTSLVSSRFIPNTIPGAPTNRAVDVATQTPNFYGSLDDKDSGATISQVRILVYQDTPSGAVLKWDSGWVASGGTRFTIAYGGTTLDIGTKYRWAAQVADNIGSQGPLSAYNEWTPTSTAGPDNMTPRTVETKQDSLTPTLTVGHSQTFTQHELQVAKVPVPSLSGDYMWLPAVPTAYAATNSKAVTYAGSALTWGKTYYWRARAFVGGTTWTEWSPWYPFYVNALPNAPKISVPAAAYSGVGVYGAYYTGITLTPTLTIPFDDPDLAKGYTDTPVSRDIEIRRADTNAVLGTYAPLTSTGTGSTHLVNTAMTAGATYKIRSRWKDSSSNYGPWSDWYYYKASTAYTITVGTAPGTTDPTPTFAWTNNRTQAKFQVVVSNNATGEVVHDSGMIVSATTSYTMPGNILQTGVTYKYVVTSYDADSLSAVLT